MRLGPVEATPGPAFFRSIRVRSVGLPGPSTGSATPIGAPRRSALGSGSSRCARSADSPPPGSRPAGRGPDARPSDLDPPRLGGFGGAMQPSATATAGMAFEIWVDGSNVASLTIPKGADHAALVGSGALLIRAGSLIEVVNLGGRGLGRHALRRDRGHPRLSECIQRDVLSPRYLRPLYRRYCIRDVRHVTPVSTGECHGVTRSRGSSGASPRRVLERPLFRGNACPANRPLRKIGLFASPPSRLPTSEYKITGSLFWAHVGPSSARDGQGTLNRPVSPPVDRGLPVDSPGRELRRQAWGSARRSA